MKIFFAFFLAAFFLQVHSLSAKDNDSIYFFRSEKVYEPLEAGILEARIGFQKYTNTDYLKLDIGASLDVVLQSSVTRFFRRGQTSSLFQIFELN